MSAPVRPYLVAGPGAVDFEGWRIESDDGWVPLPQSLPDWDYNTDLVLRSSLTVDVDELRAGTGISNGVVRLAVSWRTTDGRVAHSAFTTEVGHTTSGPLRLTMPGTLLGPEIDIHTRLVLGEDLPDAEPGVARLAGSVLWENITRLRLAGEGSRFPVVVLDFEENRLDRDASWCLEIPEDLSTPVQGGLMLMINSRDADLVAAASGTSGAARQLLTEMYEQVGAQLLDHAVVHAEELLSEVWEQGSIGATLFALARRVDGGLEALLALRENRPAAYRAMLVGEARRNGAGRTLG